MSHVYSVLIKEEELRKEGGKYSHLNEELHVSIESFAHPVDCYGRLSHALYELRRHLVPVTLVSSFVRTSFGHAVSALQPLEFGTLSLHFFLLVPVLIPSVVTSSRPSSPLNPFFVVPQFQLLLTNVCAYKLYLLTFSQPHYLLLLVPVPLPLC